MPLVVAACVERRVRFTAKATIFANPLVAAFLHRAGVVPLRRASDETPGGGAPEIGDGYPVLDTIPHSGNHPASPDPKRNAASFGAVADALAEGAAIVIFPEGKSHDAPQLAPLRTGLARMVGMARDERGVRGIRIVPVGLLFEKKEEPRTRVLVQAGEPIDVDTFLGGNATVAMLTEAVGERLAAVTSNFDSTDDAERIGLIGETLGALLEPVREIGDDVVPLSATLALVRRIDRAQRTLREPSQESRHPGVSGRIAAFETRLRAFRARLAAEHVDVHDVAITTALAPGAQFAVRETAIAAMLLPVVAWGRLTHWAPLRLARAIATRNVRARDEPAMRTLVVGALLVLVSYALETIAVGFLAGPWWALGFLASLVPSATADFRFADRLHRIRARARAYFLFRGQPSLHRELLVEAEWLRTEAGALEALATATD